MGIVCCEIDSKQQERGFKDEPMGRDITRERAVWIMKDMMDIIGRVEEGEIEGIIIPKEGLTLDKEQSKEGEKTREQIKEWLKNYRPVIGRQPHFFFSAKSSSLL